MPSRAGPAETAAGDRAPAVAVEAADRLVGILAERGPLPVDDAARALLALASGPPALARAVLDRVVADDARFVRADGSIGLAAVPLAGEPLLTARYAVVDVETTGLRASDRVVEAAVVVLEAGRVRGELELLVSAPGGEEAALRRLLAFAGDAVLCGHNLPFDARFLDRGLARGGLRVAAPVLDTLALSRRLLGQRVERHGLDRLADLLGAAHRPCHHALPDARATADVLRALLEVAAGGGARTVGDVLALARSRARGRPA